MVEEKREERKEESKSGKEKEKLFVLKENGGHVVLQPERASIFDKRERRRGKREGVRIAVHFVQTSPRILTTAALRMEVGSFHGK